MKIAIVHGYLLSGTGSNIYVVNLVSGLVDRGHDVFLFCQEPEARRFDFIDECYDFEADNRRFFSVFSRRGRGPGRARLFRPRIGSILPVYVLDEYAGFDAREFHRLPQSAIAKYVAANAQAVRTVSDAFGFDVIQANHLIAQPAIARRAAERDGTPYHVTIHGSALNYSVKKDPRLKDLALYGLEMAASVCASSDFLGEQLNEYLTGIEQPRIEVKTIYPGVELSLFQPSKDRVTPVAALAQGLRSRPGTGKNPGLKDALRAVVRSSDRKRIRTELATQTVYDRRAPDRDLASTLEDIDWRRERIVVFVGKYLAAKGLHAAILAAPLIVSDLPTTRILAVGFGDRRELFEALLTALATGQGQLVVDLTKTIEADATRAVGGAFLNELRRSGGFNAYLSAAARAGLSDKFLFTGPLAHEDLAQLLPAADLLISPSIFPEAFGMVAVEALAAGIYPILTDDFGMAEVARLVRAATRDIWPDQPSLTVSDDFVPDLAGAVIETLKQPYIHRSDFKKSLRKLAVDRFSWDRVVDDYLRLFIEHRRQVAKGA